MILYAMMIPSKMINDHHPKSPWGLCKWENIDLPHGLRQILSIVIYIYNIYYNITILQYITIYYITIYIYSKKLIHWAVSIGQDQKK